MLRGEWFYPDEDIKTFIRHLSIVKTKQDLSNPDSFAFIILALLKENKALRKKQAEIIKTAKEEKDRVLSENSRLKFEMGKEKLKKKAISKEPVAVPKVVPKGKRDVFTAALHKFCGQNEIPTPGMIKRALNSL